MKRIVKLSTIPSLLAAAGCLALPHAAHAQPLNGTLTIDVGGDVMAMGGASLGSDSMLMLMGSPTVTGSTGGFIPMGVMVGDSVTLSSTMFMPASVEGMLMESSVPSWMFMGMGPEMFSSTGPNNLQFMETGMTMGGGYDVGAAELTGVFTESPNGAINGTLTVSAGSAVPETANLAVTLAPIGML